MGPVATRSYQLTRLCFKRALAFIYFVAFLVSAQQFAALAGEKGLSPLPFFYRQVSFRDFPGLFWLNGSDSFTASIAWAGVGLSLFALSGFSEKFGSWVSSGVWGTLWLFYLSFVNAGQTFYSFGWETMTLEMGFLAIWMGSDDTRVPEGLIWFVRWVLFRLMFGAGLIKLRGDACWRDLTCMFYHYETQPIPNPLSWYFHHFPAWLHKLEVLFTHFMEILVPWMYWVAGPVGWVAGGLTIIFQTILILSGNLSWLNYLTIVLCLVCFDDDFLRKFFGHRPRMIPPPIGRTKTVLLRCLYGLLIFLSIGPAVNLVSPRQAMNASFEPLHLVNTYGAFGSVTRVRREIVFEGTSDFLPFEGANWKEYEFIGKPVDVHRLQPVISPYHRRLDWLLWFAAMQRPGAHPWVLPLAAKLLKNDPKILSLIEKNPFPDQPPRYVRAILYEYRFTNETEKKETGDWWVRRRIGDYLPPLSLDNPKFISLLKSLGWQDDPPAN